MSKLLREFVKSIIEASGEAQAKKRQLVMQMSNDIKNALNSMKGEFVKFNEKTGEIRPLAEADKHVQLNEQGVLYHLDDVAANYDLPAFDLIIADWDDYWGGASGVMTSPERMPTNKSLLLLRAEISFGTNFDDKPSDGVSHRRSLTQNLTKKFRESRVNVLEFIANNASSIYDSMSSVARHELVHYLDMLNTTLKGRFRDSYNVNHVIQKINKLNFNQERMSGESHIDYNARVGEFNKKSQKIRNDWYFNHGIEIEAYIQQALMDIEYQIDSGKISPDILGKRPEDFLKVVKNWVDHRFLLNIRPSTQKAFMKRVVLAWEQLKNKYA